MATRETLERRLRRHQRNLEALEVERTKYGYTTSEPVTVQEAIIREEQTIEEIEAELAALDAESQHHLNDSDGADTSKQAQMDAAQLSRIENKLDTLTERTFDTRQRMAALERDMADMAQRMARLEAQVAAMQHGPENVNRTWLVSGAVLLLSMFVVVMILAWRLL